MNRASLLHILDHATGISEAEVRELEQLAAAFPYCQTAHLLLAKAAHDRGSMLASQRLRRAATYASDRELLRYLIELPAPAAETGAALPVPAAPLSLPEQEPESQPVLPEPVAEAPAPDSAAAGPEPVAVATEAAALPVLAVAAPDLLPPQPDEAVTPVDQPAAAEPADEAPASPEEALAVPLEPTTSATPEDQPLVEQEEVLVFPGNEPAEAAAPEAAVSVPETAAGVAAEPEPPAAVEPAEPVSAEPAPETLEAEPAAPDSELPLVDLMAEPTADELPPLAPPIRPPVEAGSSRFEFGLGETPIPVPAYQLPELPAETEAAPLLIPPFRADEQLAYALAAGSRLGYCLTLREAELTQDLPLSADWHPDAAVLAHIAANRPAPPPAPSSLALIDRFLRSQPRIKNAARPAPTDAPQDDLSVRSTSAPPSLASESLAKILVKQGKTARAIEIYEQLMQRQPEKKAYFAAQIDLLTQQPE
jgi:hypothetical protein